MVYVNSLILRNWKNLVIVEKEPTRILIPSVFCFGMLRRPDSYLRNQVSAWGTRPVINTRNDRGEHVYVVLVRSGDRLIARELCNLHSIGFLIMGKLNAEDVRSSDLNTHVNGIQCGLLFGFTADAPLSLAQRALPSSLTLSQNSSVTLLD